MAFDSCHVKSLVQRNLFPRLSKRGITFLFRSSLRRSLANKSSSPGLNKTPVQQLIPKPVKSAVILSSLRQSIYVEAE
jgi:hypothetical protein